MFVERTYVDFLRKISRASLGLDDYAKTYFVRLENQLLVDSPTKQPRRIIQDFDKVKYRQQLAVTRLLQAQEQEDWRGNIYTHWQPSKQKRFIAQM